MLTPDDIKQIQKMIYDASGFVKRQLGDTPSDALQFTPRRYVNLNGPLAQRPASVAATMGQQYYATDLDKPIFFDGDTNKWRDATSSIIASN